MSWYHCYYVVRCAVDAVHSLCRTFNSVSVANELHDVGIALERSVIPILINFFKHEEMKMHRTFWLLVQKHLHVSRRLAVSRPL